MAADHLIGIERFEADLWKVADNLRANSNLASNEYFMPVLGLIFLRQATNRYYYGAGDEIERDVASGAMPRRELIEADFSKRRAMMLPMSSVASTSTSSWSSRRRKPTITASFLPRPRSYRRS